MAPEWFKPLLRRVTDDHISQEELVGQLDEALKLLEKFHELLTTDTAVSQDLGKLVVFCGVRDYPARVKCATLAWHTLKSALSAELTEPVSTE